MSLWQQKSPSYAAITVYNQAVSTHLLFFSLFLSPWLLFIWYLTHPRTNHHRFRSNYTPKKHPIHPIGSDQSPKHQQNSHAPELPVSTMFSSRNRKWAPPQPRGHWTPQRRHSVSPSIGRIRELSRVSQIKQHSNAVYLPQTANYQPPSTITTITAITAETTAAAVAAQRYPTRPTR